MSMENLAEAAMPPPSKERVFLDELGKLIEFYRTNGNDPYNIDNAAICIIIEFRDEYKKAFKL